jgi:hypothetical protein
MIDMGTNYYYIVPKCPTCGNRDILHIGKSSAGWKFMFRAHPEKEIKAFRDWVRVLSRGDGHIEDEYGRKIEFYEFLRMVYYKQEHEPQSHAVANPSDNDYLDGDGFSFSRGEFS